MRNSLARGTAFTKVRFCKSYPENLYSIFFLQTSKKKREYQKKKTFLPCARLVCNAMAQTSERPNSRAPCWLLPLRRTTVRRNGFLTPRFRQYFYTRLRNGKAFWFDLPYLTLPGIKKQHQNYLTFILFPLQYVFLLFSLECWR